VAFERARQSLSDIEDRLRRAFGLAGPIGASLTPDLSPVMIAGDLREPGHSFNRGRSFVYWSDLMSTAANQYHTVQFNVAVLIEALYFPPMILNGTVVRAYSTVPGQTPAQAITRQGMGAWRDNRLVDTDIPPIADSGAATGALGGGTDFASNRMLMQWHGVVPLGGTPNDVGERRMMIHLAAGSCINMRIPLTISNYSYGIWGRIWG